jgi:hypothetical protein
VAQESTNKVKYIDITKKGNAEIVPSKKASKSEIKIRAET